MKLDDLTEDDLQYDFSPRTVAFIKERLAEIGASEAATADPNVRGDCDLPLIAPARARGTVRIDPHPMA